MASGRNLLLQCLVPSREEARFGGRQQQSQFQADFYLVVAAGYDGAPEGLVLESEMILRCKATEVLR